ncbi:MAG: hypothetical protein AAGA58_14395 [Verrucomicrobiota bacterium]
MIWLCGARGEVVVIDAFEGRPAGMVSGKMLPPQGQSGISDPANVLGLEAREDLATLLANAKEEGVEGFLVILESTPELDAEHLANEMLKRWASAESTVSFLILTDTSTGDRPLVLIMDSGKATPELIAGIQVGAEALMEEMDEIGATPEFLRDLAEHLISQATPSSNAPQEVPAKPLLVETTEEIVRAENEGSVSPAFVASDTDQETQENNRVDSPTGKILRYALVAGGGLAGLFVLGMMLRFLVRRARFRAKRFPEVEIHERLGAPYSGGNSARVLFANPDTKLK